MGDGKEVAIENVAIGDMIRTFDEPTGKFTASPVTKTFHHGVSEDTIVEMALSNGRRLIPNARHLIYANGSYQSAGDIALAFLAGQPVIFAGADTDSLSPTSVFLEFVTIRKSTESFYNLHVRSPHDQPFAESDIGHNYVAEGIVVHNLKVLENALAERQAYDEACWAQGGESFGSNGSAQSNYYATCRKL